MKDCLILFSLVLLFEECRLVRGYSDVKVATEKIQEIANEVKYKVESVRRYKDLMKIYRAVEFEEQVVAGTNYRIKLQIDDDYFVTIKVYKPLMGKKAEFKGFMKKRNLPLPKPSGPLLPLWSVEPFQPFYVPIERLYSESKAATDEIQKIVDQVIPEAKTKLNENSIGDIGEHYMWVASSYRTQEVPTGTFYEIEVQTQEFTFSRVTVLKKICGAIKFVDAIVWAMI